MDVTKDLSILVSISTLATIILVPTGLILIEFLRNKYFKNQIRVTRR